MKTAPAKARWRSKRCVVAVWRPMTKYGKQKIQQTLVEPCNFISCRKAQVSCFNNSFCFSRSGEQHFCFVAQSQSCRRVSPGTIFFRQRSGYQAKPLHTNLIYNERTSMAKTGGFFFEQKQQRSNLTSLRLGATISTGILKHIYPELGTHSVKEKVNTCKLYLRLRIQGLLFDFA